MAEDVRDAGGTPVWPRVVRLAAAGAAVVLLLPEDGLPEVLHWGSDIGESR